MKTIITFIIALIFSINAVAGNPNNHPDTYCAKIKDGKKVIMHDGYVLTSEVTLANGTKIQIDGTIIKKDGTKGTLKEGECISKEGVMTEEIAKKSKSKSK